MKVLPKTALNDLGLNPTAGEIKLMTVDASLLVCLFVCVEVLRPSQPTGGMSSWSVYLTTLLLGRLSPLCG